MIQKWNQPAPRLCPTDPVPSAAGSASSRSRLPGSNPGAPQGSVLSPSLYRQQAPHPAQVEKLL